MKAKKVKIFTAILFCIGLAGLKAQTVTDIDGNIYNTVTIGIQTWMKENLKVTKYCNGEPIPNVTDITAWSTLTTGAYCDYDNTPGNSKIYGKLYNWYSVVDTRNLCPPGWHIATDAEWTALTSYLGGESFSGGKLKETGTTNWTSPNTCATNETGFTALPCGFRVNTGKFQNLWRYGYLWSTTDNSTSSAWGRSMYYFHSSVVRFDGLKKFGFSVRCLKN